MRKRFAISLAAGALVVSMLPGAVSADVPNPKINCVGAALSNQVTPGAASGAWAATPSYFKKFMAQFPEDGEYIVYAAAADDYLICQSMPN